VAHSGSLDAPTDTFAPLAQAYRPFNCRVCATA